MTIQLPRLRFLAPLFAASVFCAAALGGYFPFGGASVLLACFLLFLLAASVRPTRREWGMAAIPAALFAFFRTVGYSYDTTDSYGLLLKNAKTLLSGALAMAALFAAALCAVVLLFRLLGALRERAQAVLEGGRGLVAEVALERRGVYPRRPHRRARKEGSRKADGHSGLFRHRL